MGLPCEPHGAFMISSYMGLPSWDSRGTLMVDPMGFPWDHITHGASM